MLGNVFEWCWDWWRKYTADEQTDPIGPGSGINRVVRGGCYFISAKGLRSGQRDYSAVDIRWRGNGLRVARNAE